MKTISTKEKAVQINIESGYYGTIAEIGGGQETARHLFQAGGASNTVAKTVSAYDKSFSDHFYNEGQPARYVAEERLSKMLSYEYNELVQILEAKIEQRFFSFANTVETINFSKTNQGNGWLGIALEGSDRHNPNRFLMHVKLLEKDTLLQQYTLGTLGINLIHGGLFHGKDPRNILAGLLDNLDTDRVEVDYVYSDGPDYNWVDNRLLNLMLVSRNMTPAIMFDPQGRVQQPGEMLYRKNVLLVRGYFRPINNLGMELINDSMHIFKRDENYKPDNTITCCEISLNYLMEGEEVKEKDFLHRVDLLNLMGQSVMISRFGRYFELVNYFAQFRMIKLRVVMGLPTFDKLFADSWYDDLKGGLLQAMGILFQENVKVYLYPGYQPDEDILIQPDDNHFPPAVRPLWDYLYQSGKIIIIRDISTENMSIASGKITELIESGSKELSKHLPKPVYNHIVKHGLFGFPS